VQVCRSKDCLSCLKSLSSLRLCCFIAVFASLPLYDSLFPFLRYAVAKTTFTFLAALLCFLVLTSWFRTFHPTRSASLKVCLLSSFIRPQSVSTKKQFCLVTWNYLLDESLFLLIATWCWVIAFESLQYTHWSFIQVIPFKLLIRSVWSFKWKDLAEDLIAADWVYSIKVWFFQNLLTGWWCARLFTFLCWEV